MDNFLNEGNTKRMHLSNALYNTFMVEFEKGRVFFYQFHVEYQVGYLSRATRNGSNIVVRWLQK